MNDAVLSVKDVGYCYAGNAVLEQISFELQRGSFTVLLGPNGAGKSTLISLICRLLESRQGEIRICGEAIRHEPENALRHIGIVFQQPTLDLDLSVRQNLLYFAALRGMSKTEATSRVDDELERLEMSGMNNRTIRQLNGGHRRRVEIARALLHQPDLLILDEPTVGLDIPTRRQFVDYAHNLASDRGVTVLWASHLIDEVNIETDNALLLHKGKVRASGSVAGLLEQHHYSDLPSFYQAETGGDLA